MRHHLVLAAAILLMAASPPPQSAPRSTLVALQAQPGSALDRVARGLIADDLAAATQRGDRPLLLIGTARLGGERPSLFVQLQSPQECGSAGCTTSVYAWVRGNWTRVLDGTTGRLAVASTRTRGMADLLANDERYVWTGSDYRNAHPALPWTCGRGRPGTNAAGT